MPTDSLIGPHPPSDGREWDCQCARCGSSCEPYDCANCGGEGEIEDEDWQFEGEYHRCDWCRGTGGGWECCAAKEWCDANPQPGRESFQRGKIEWFVIRRVPRGGATDAH